MSRRARRVRVKAPRPGDPPITYRDWPLLGLGLICLGTGVWQGYTSVVDLPQWISRPPSLADRYWAAGFAAFFFFLGFSIVPVRLQIYADRVEVRNVFSRWTIPVGQVESGEDSFGHIMFVLEDGRRVRAWAAPGSLAGQLTGSDERRAERLETTIEVLRERAAAQASESHEPPSLKVTRRWRTNLLPAAAAMLLYGLFGLVAQSLEIGV